MEEAMASVTAMSVARMRAIHTRLDPEPVLNDPWGDQLIPAALLVEALGQGNADAGGITGGSADEELARITDDYLRASPAFTNVVVRARYTEDALAAAIARGVRQYVLIGAGFDSYALRLPPEANAVAVIEIDHPATQALKKQRLSECDLEVPDNVHFVAADLTRESLAQVLERSTFNPAEPAFFAWLGVTMYLTREENMATLKSIAEYSAAGSEVVFSYVDQIFFEPSGSAEAKLFRELEETVQSLGEPFVSGFHPGALAADLGAVGLELLEDVDEYEMVKRFDPAGANGLKPAGRSHVALVRTGGSA